MISRSCELKRGGGGRGAAWHLSASPCAEIYRPVTSSRLGFLSGARLWYRIRIYLENRLTSTSHRWLRHVEGLWPSGTSRYSTAWPAATSAWRAPRAVARFDRS